MGGPDLLMVFPVDKVLGCSLKGYVACFEEDEPVAVPGKIAGVLGGHDDTFAPLPF
jgi:hypothetical protein